MQQALCNVPIDRNLRKVAISRETALIAIA